MCAKLEDSKSAAVAASNSKGQSSQGKKKKKGSSSAGKKEDSVVEEAKEMSLGTATDDDEFKSAESRTPPKERYDPAHQLRGKNEHKVVSVKQTS